MTESVETKEASVACAANKVKEGVVELKDAVTAQTSDALNACCETTRDMIKSRPYTSVLVAFGLGALAAALIFGGRRRD